MFDIIVSSVQFLIDWLVSALSSCFNICHFFLKTIILSSSIISTLPSSIQYLLSSLILFLSFIFIAKLLALIISSIKVW